MLKIAKKIFSLVLIGISLIFIFISLHSYFILRKADLYFMISGLLFSGIGLIISLLLFFNKIKFINDALNKKNYNLNILVGICCIIISVAFIYSSKSSLLRSNSLRDIGGILFFGLGGLALLLKGFEQRSK